MFVKEIISKALKSFRKNATYLYITDFPYFDDTLDTMELILSENEHRRFSGYLHNARLEGREAERRANTAIITRIIFNGKATIVFWSDGTKTISKCHEKDSANYSEEAGVAIAVMKKLLDDPRRFSEVLKELVDNAERY